TRESQEPLVSRPERLDRPPKPLSPSRNVATEGRANELPPPYIGSTSPPKNGLDAGSTNAGTTGRVVRCRGRTPPPPERLLSAGEPQGDIPPCNRHQPPRQQSAFFLPLDRNFS